ncbi:hypothetical protein CYMTET_14105 [Cymbomonas tetramitiformis]|uniref:Uncharacterized protein n=1 Tax=Cymbomonas tetramitiformis TaxID=36881 RepID=A0AAE0LAJ2_9CHLO|nr:hypothetical protein CYMTET_14105 [Cymbomonas tetramitiformis]
MDWFTDVNACQQKVDDLKAHASYVEAASALENGDTLAPAQEKLMRQMATFTSRLSILREESLQAVGGARKRPWLDAVDYDELPGNDRQELTRAGLEKDSFKGVRKQFDEVKHHYGAHVATGAALDEARKALEGTQLPSNVVEALAFCVETAEKGVARARERGKVLAMVVDEGTEVGWKMAEKLERRSCAENDEEDKACRRARKEVKAENEAKAKANAAKQKARDQRPRPAVQQQLPPFSPPPAVGAGGLDVEFSEEELENVVAIVEQGVAVPRVAGRLREHASFWRTFVTNAGFSWRARKEVKAENEAKAKANAAKQKARDQRPRPAVQQQLPPFSPPPAAGAGGLDVEFSEEELENVVAIVEQGVAVPRVAGRLREHASFWRTFVTNAGFSWYRAGGTHGALADPSSSLNLVVLALKEATSDGGNGSALNSLVMSGLLLSGDMLSTLFCSESRGTPGALA